MTTRTRGVRTEAENGGTPCQKGSETKTCMIQACDKDCDLADWTDWEPCSKMCNGGTQRHSRPVTEARRGEGDCPDPNSEDRLGYKSCNQFSCNFLLPQTRPILKCKSKLDVVVLLDGSGSLGQTGWDLSKKFAETFVSSLVGGEDGVSLAFMLFSGPRTWPGVARCSSTDPTLDMATDCNIRWISHFTTDIAKVEEEVKKMSWPQGSTLTSAALAEAASELTYSRADANSIVVVITDGKPLSVRKTQMMSDSLRKKARLMYVPVGRYAPITEIMGMASSPRSDNVVIVKSFHDMTTPFTMNSIIAGTCPVVG